MHVNRSKCCSYIQKNNRFYTTNTFALMYIEAKKKLAKPWNQESIIVLETAFVDFKSF